MHFRKTTATITVLTLFFFKTPVVSEAQIPHDVENGDYHFLAISNMAEKGVIKGYDDGSFRPYNNITRAEALKIIMLGSGLFTEESIEDMYKNIIQRPFTDTPLEVWSTKYIHAAKEAGIINGYEDNSFKPNENINLAEALKIFVETTDPVLPEITDEIYFDVPNDSWFAPYFNFAKKRTALDIQLNNLAHPDQILDRGYFTEIIYRFQGFSEGYKFGKASFYGGIPKDGHLTAAHKTLPKGTLVEVTNLANGKTVNVIINDRGPYGHGREIDLSRDAFATIGELSTGIINVQYKVIE